MRSRESGIAQVAAFAVVALQAAPAQAYIDPGTGSMLLQLLGAVIAGAIFYFRELRYKILSLFSRHPAPDVDDRSAPPADDPPR
jgi:hypothetical protein